MEQDAPAAAEESLILWHRRYLAEDADSICPESDVILEVESDQLDDDEMDKQMKQSILTTDVAQGFCAKCRYLLRHWPDLPGGFESGVGRLLLTAGLKAAALQGCRFCAFILSILKDRGMFTTLCKIETRLRRIGDGAKASLSIQSWENLAVNWTHLLWVNFPGKVASSCFSHYAWRSRWLSHIVYPSEHYVWLESLEPLELAKTWLRDCTESHSLCCSIRENEPPTRLISVRDGIVRLVLTESLETIPLYATLSYCWGQEPFKKLTADTLTAFLRDISLQGLPQTFQDAIYVTRRLGLEYVWIDALCIIQDRQVGRGEETDWEKEVGKMEAVYGGAHVGLAASDASDVHGGFFRKPQHYNGGFSARVSSKVCSRIQRFHEDEIYENSSKNTHLAGRAWALQEKLLAARTISFGRGGLFWECKSTIKSEYLPGGFKDRLSPHAVRPENIAWDWSEVVKDYSSAALTVDSDRLPALSGIARRQHGITGDQYLAGMWRKELEIRLPWRCIVRPQRRPNWRAPTWSWASINGPVRYPTCWDKDVQPPDSTYISVLDVSTSPAGTDPFGAVAKGSLTLACSAILDAYIEDIEGEDKNSGEKAMLLGTAMAPFTVNMDHLDDEFGRRNAGFYLLPVASGYSGRIRTADGEDIEAQSFHGIVLRDCSIKKHEFCRVGSFWFKTGPPQSKEDVTWREKYDYLIRITEEEGSSMAESRCARILTKAEESMARYVITIV